MKQYILVASLKNKDDENYVEVTAISSSEKSLLHFEDFVKDRIVCVYTSPKMDREKREKAEKCNFCIGVELATSSLTDKEMEQGFPDPCPKCGWKYGWD